jgi:Raf kinase inhibitor-like YbhB/YbcL family protein
MNTGARVAPPALAREARSSHDGRCLALPTIVPGEEYESMKLTSPAFDDGQLIPVRYTCDGDNVSPELHWIDVPEGTAELALTCQDPDAPRGTFTHWVVWHLDPQSKGLPTGEVPAGASQGLNDFGHVGYDGPCPPPGHGTHHYHFVLHATATAIALPEGATIAELHLALRDAVLTRAELVGTYAR